MGYIHDQAPLSELKLPLKLKWRREKDIPFEISTTLAVLNEKVYIGGGFSFSKTVLVYDPTYDCYDTLPPYMYQSFSMAVVNNQLVLVGGSEIRNSGTKTNRLGVWNEQSKRWTHPLPPMTTACKSSSVVTHNNRWLVVMGGYDGKTHCSRVEILDTDSTQWYHAASLPQPLSRALPAIIGNMCYLLGGYTEGATTSQKVFSVCLDDLISQAVSQPASASAPPTPSPWQSLPDTPLKQSTALVFNGALLAVGGDYGSTTICHYQPSSRSWVKAGELPTRQSTCTCTVLPSGDLYVAGGGGGFGTAQRVDIASVQVQ